MVTHRFISRLLWVFWSVILNLNCSFQRGNVEIARMLLCLGARTDIKNRYKETARHLAARLSDKWVYQFICVFLIICSFREAKMDLVRALIICKAPACDAGFVGCAFGCMHTEGLGACKAQMGSAEDSNVEKSVSDVGVSGQASSAAYEFVLDPDTQLVDEAYAERNETRAFPHDQAMQRVKNKLKELVEQKKSSNVINVLGLDGGGIRGLVTVQMLISLEEYLDRPLIDYFDWIGATSTGCYIMSTLMTGGSLRHAQRYYLQFKDQLFDCWSRPYCTETLEGFIKRTFGTDRKMGDIKYPRFFCTTVRADTFPVQLDLCRNYRLPVSDKENDDLGFTDPNGNFISEVPAKPNAFRPLHVESGPSFQCCTHLLLSFRREVHRWRHDFQQPRSRSNVWNLLLEHDVSKAEAPRQDGRRGMCPVRRHWCHTDLSRGPVGFRDERLDGTAAWHSQPVTSRHRPGDSHGRSSDHEEQVVVPLSRHPVLQT